MKAILSLPQIGGIYLLEREGVLQYVGKAADFSASLRQYHLYDPKVQQVYILEIENSHLRASVEAAMIGAIRPPLNTKFNLAAIELSVAEPDLIEGRDMAPSISLRGGKILAEIGHLLIMAQMEEMIKDQFKRHQDEGHQLSFDRCDHPDCARWARSTKHWHIRVPT